MHPFKTAPCEVSSTVLTWCMWIANAWSDISMKGTASGQGCSCGWNWKRTNSTTVHNHIENKRWLACSAALQASALTRDKGHVGCKLPTSQPVPVPVPKLKTVKAPRAQGCHQWQRCRSEGFTNFSFDHDLNINCLKPLGCFLGKAGDVMAATKLIPLDADFLNSNCPCPHENKTLPSFHWQV